MRKNNSSLFSLLVLALLLFGIFFFMMPQSYDQTEAPLSEFSTKRALSIVKEISKKPHFVGSKNHEVIANYLQKELQDLGLETSVQEGFTMTEKGTLVKSKNIIAKIKGSKKNKALLLLSHYDSAPHSYSKGASDDASGIATILESVRAFLHNKTPHKNDIIIRVASPKLITEEAPESYKNVCDVIETCQDAGISEKVVKLRPIAVIKG